jgi:hypothetical protein
VHIFSILVEARGHAYSIRELQSEAIGDIISMVIHEPTPDNPTQESKAVSPDKHAHREVVGTFSRKKEQ